MGYAGVSLVMFCHAFWVGLRSDGVCFAQSCLGGLRQVKHFALRYVVFRLATVGWGWSCQEFQVELCPVWLDSVEFGSAELGQVKHYKKF